MLLCVKLKLLRGMHINLLIEIPEKHLDAKTVQKPKAVIMKK